MEEGRSEFWGIFGIILSALLSGSNILTLFLYRRQKRANDKLSEANAVLAEVKIAREIIEMYEIFMKAHKEDKAKDQFEKGMIQEEISMLRDIIHKTTERCSACPNNPQKTKKIIQRIKKKRHGR